MEYGEGGISPNIELILRKLPCQIYVYVAFYKVYLETVCKYIKWGFNVDSFWLKGNLYT